MYKPLVLCAGLLCLWAPAPARQDRVVCGTHREKWREELHLHRSAERVRVMRMKQSGLQAQPARAAKDLGNIAILSDGDGVVAQRNEFNLVYQTLSFLPSTSDASAYRFRVRENTYDPALATDGTPLSGLADDDARELDLPFTFPLFGVSHRRVFVNSDGNLTFGAPDTATSERSLGRMTAGPPRIAGLFRDLDPSRATEGVRVLSQPDRFVVSWVAVPEYSDFGIGPKQTFQIRLYPDGRIEMAFQDVNTTSAVVGIAPGELKGTTAVVSFTGGSPAEYSAALAEVFRLTTEVDVVRVAQKFYETHDDAYDYLVIFNTLGVRAGESAVAFETTVRNNRSGYGDIQVDVGRQLGSAYRLQALQNMGPLSQYPRDPYGIITARRASRDTPMTVIAHEAGHLFLAFASVRDQDNPESRPMLGYQSAHWTFAFNSEASLLEGNRIEDRTNASPRFVTTGTVEGFSPLDQYLMGLRAPDEVASTFVVLNTNPNVRLRLPEVGVGFDGERRNIEIQELIEAEGRRTPDSTVAQRYFRFAFILVTKDGLDPTAQELAQIERYRSEFETYYRRATSERGWADATLKRGLRLSMFPAAGVLVGGTAPASLSLARPADADLTVMLKTQSGAAGVPASVIIPAGETNAAFQVAGIRTGVEELIAEPADPAYETVHARIQVSSGADGIRLLPAGQTTPLTVRVTDINNLPYPGVTVRASSGAELASAVTGANGQATLEWIPGPASSQIRISADGVAGSFILGPSGNPALSAGSVVNAASSVPGLVPGGIASIYGVNLSAGATMAAPFPWPGTLAGVRVTVAGRIAPLLYVSDGQINFLAPSDLPEGIAELTVTTPAGSSAPVQVRVSSASPGIFAVVVWPDRQSTMDRPAHRLEYLEIYCTGLGAVYNGETVFVPTARIGGVSARVTFSGLAPGFLGLYQVNAQVPQTVGSGVQGLTLALSGAISNAVPVRIE